MYTGAMGIGDWLFGKARDDQLPGNGHAQDIQSVGVTLIDPEGDRLDTHRALMDAIVGAAGVAGFAAGAIDEKLLRGGPHTHTLRIEGPDAEAIFEAIAPTIEGVPLPVGSHAILTYGSDPTARHERVDLQWDG